EIGLCDVVLVLTKSYATAWAGEQAHMLMRPEGARGREGEECRFTPSPPHPLTPSPTLVVTLQNGLGNRELLAQALGDARVGQGITALGATLLGLGQVRQAGQGSTVFGTTPDRAG